MYQLAVQVSAVTGDCVVIGLLQLCIVSCLKCTKDNYLCMYTSMYSDMYRQTIHAFI